MNDKKTVKKDVENKVKRKYVSFDKVKEELFKIEGVREGYERQKAILLKQKASDKK